MLHTCAVTQSFLCRFVLRTTTAQLLWICFEILANVSITQTELETNKKWRISSQSNLLCFQFERGTAVQLHPQWQHQLFPSNHRDEPHWGKQNTRSVMWGRHQRKTTEEHHDREIWSTGKSWWLIIHQKEMRAARIWQKVQRFDRPPRVVTEASLFSWYEALLRPK